MERANYWQKDMQTNKKRKIYYKPLKKSRNRKSVSPANIFGSFFFLIQFHMLRADPIFRVDGFCLSTKHFFSAVLTSFLGRNAELCLIWKIEKPALKTSRASWNSCFLKSHLFQDTLYWRAINEGQLLAVHGWFYNQERWPICWEMLTVAQALFDKNRIPYTLCNTPSLQKE